MMPVTPHFVFDGRKRPHVKRDKLVKGDEDWLVEPFKRILDSYGFVYSTVCMF